ncbi:trypco2 family protein [Streptomyces sp. TS71-3]|uniref:trypco2 family protein n=1 Tax=Streptomyces sp. TS71-3 TaxID=2733862 RepID=UPI001B2E9F33|nr:trypco2 family protein [Streptomyces sp. TS71-3]GHJ37988.1 hypothetical protein Sm713_35970 [Streptomyces sp. TS71-3]
MRVELSEVIAELRAELSAAMHAGDGEELRFELGPVELELTLAVSRDAGPSAKVKFWVVEMGADAKLSTQSTQRIRLSLEPRRAGAPDSRMMITGDSLPGER